MIFTKIYSFHLSIMRFMKIILILFMKPVNSHTAATAAGNHGVPVIVDGFNYGYASGMAPGAR